MSMRTLAKDAGVCMAEVLIALAAGAVVFSAAVQSLQHFHVRLSGQQKTMATTQDVRIGLKVFEDEMRQAGSGASLSEAPVQAAGSQDVTFLANLGGLITILTGPVSANQNDLPVADGSDWPKGKRIVLCERDHCAAGQLAKDGRKGTLSLTGPVGQDFQAGSDIRVSNAVRYYLGQDRNSRPVLMRQVDGGANPLIGSVEEFQLSYFDRSGAPTVDPSRVARLRVQLRAGTGGRTIVKEIGLRMK